MFLSQLKAGGIICRQGEAARLVPGFNSTYELAKAAIAAGTTVAALIEKHGQGDTVDLVALAAEGKLDCPVRHPDPAHMYLTGTGLTHTGSASARDNMHADTAGMSDSMKMFRMGLEGGKPKPGETGVQPEWFYKGNGFNAVAPGDDLVSPSFALDGGEEPEMAGYYIIGDDGTAHRLGFSVANEFSDHVTEKINYLFLAHSKLRPASFGPELRVGALPDHVEGTSRIVRGGQTVWEKPFLSGEANMSHTIANLEYHHFKYALFCQPGDLHIHMYGTATLSVADGFVTQEGDVFEIESPQFGLPLRNRLAKAAAETVKVKML
ncbi:MAG: GguC protein [Alphaproteobacteria bacterium]|uniref:AraD1 family protein n=1 Tax=Rhizobium sp. AAP116 TaxID=1523429 RepID=UPI0006B933FA|nr:AraD1 family protein [Rhizobium sp. AAP116]KPF57718.1 GguC protein [Rhizobium sp. AAP116]MBU0738547.1 GguC protein [Alphaproteobacteria bacterium]MBU0831399.1 GguC protein [Alphaproteobacteria bacterium]MBU1762345.1 GguC protein [Alphaproteobacteria bacterium]